MTTIVYTSTVQVDLDTIRQEVVHLVEKGILHPQQPIYLLASYFPAREWPAIEWELEKNDYLLRDRLIDLLGCRAWGSD